MIIANFCNLITWFLFSKACQIFSGTKHLWTKNFHFIAIIPNSVTFRYFTDTLYTDCTLYYIVSHFFISCQSCQMKSSYLEVIKVFLISLVYQSNITRLIRKSKSNNHSILNLTARKWTFANKSIIAAIFHKSM